MTRHSIDNPFMCCNLCKWQGIKYWYKIVTEIMRHNLSLSLKSAYKIPLIIYWISLFSFWESCSMLYKNVGNILYICDDILKATHSYYKFAKSGLSPNGIVHFPIITSIILEMTLRWVWYPKANIQLSPAMYAIWVGTIQRLKKRLLTLHKNEVTK